jgi:hypothetical protein
MSETLAEQLTRVGKKLEAQGYVVCDECQREVTKVRPNGVCPECERAKWRPAPKPKAVEKKDGREPREDWDDREPD